MRNIKYAEDYHLENELGRNGKLKTVPVYHGPYFRFAAGEGTVRRAKLLYSALSLLCLFAALAPLLMDTGMARSRFVVLPLVLCLLPVTQLLMGVWRLLTAGEQVTREHRDKLYDRFAGWSMVLLLLSALSLPGQAAYCLHGSLEGADLAVTACTVVLISASAVLFARKKALLMEEVPSKE